jgi:DNA-binding beta-propeller fold protein YncE
MSRLLQLFAAAALAAGCADPDPHLVHEYDPFTGSAYPDQRPPIAVPPGGLGVVTDSLSDTLSLLDLGAGERIASVPVGRDPVGLDGPHHIAVDLAGGAVYVGLSYPDLGATGPHASHGSSLQPGYAQRLALSDFEVLGQVRVDESPGDIVLSEDGARLVISHFDLRRALQNPGDLEKARATLAVLDPETIAAAGSPAPARITTCVAPHGVALSRPDGALAFVACYGEDAIAIVDLDAGEVEQLVPVSPAAGAPGHPSYGPYAAVLSPDGATLAIGSTVSKDVRFLDVASRSIDPCCTAPTLGAPFFPAWSEDGALLYVPTQAPDAIAVLDVAAGGQEVARRDFAADECVAPHLVQRYGAGALLVVCEGDHQQPGRVLWLDRATLTTERAADVGVYPDGLAIVPGGGG